MSTHAVRWQDYRGSAIQWVEIVDEPIAFDQAEAHLELGGAILAIREGVPYHVFSGQDSGPGFVALWPDVKWHIVVGVRP